MGLLRREEGCRGPVLGDDSGRFLVALATPLGMSSCTEEAEIRAGILGVLLATCYGVQNCVGK